MPLDAKKAPETGDWSLRLEKCMGVKWLELNLTSFERHRCEPINRYHWATDFSNSYYLKFCPDEGEIADCTAAQVINGYNRPLDAKRYKWVSDPAESLPQSLDLTWQQAVDIKEVRITFDSDLKHPAFSYLRLPIVRQLVKDYDIDVQVNGEWIKVIEERGNIMRHRIHSMNVSQISRVRITILATYGCASASIVEVRAY